MPPKEAKPGDKKPDDKKDEGGGLAKSSDVFSFLGGFVIVIFLGNYLIRRIIDVLSGRASGRLGEIASGISDFYQSFKRLSLAVSFLLAIFIGYLVKNINQMSAEENKRLYPDLTQKKGGEDEAGNARWQQVVDHLESDNPSDWKLAIIEADIILDEMLDSMQYEGDSVGEKLKKVERSDFTSIDKAWEAHKIRNLIAHEGAGFKISKREAVRVIGLYKEVFEEFYFI